jgi:hypothetical protein
MEQKKRITLRRTGMQMPFFVKSSISTECVEIRLAVKNREDSGRKGHAAREEEGKLNAHIRMNEGKP